MPSMGHARKKRLLAGKAALSWDEYLSRFDLQLVDPQSNTYLRDAVELRRRIEALGGLSPHPQVRGRLSARLEAMGWLDGAGLNFSNNA